jgi:hypothetical protein
LNFIPAPPLHIIFAVKNEGVYKTKYDKIQAILKVLQMRSKTIPLQPDFCPYEDKKFGPSPKELVSNEPSASSFG